MRLFKLLFVLSTVFLLTSCFGDDESSEKVDTEENESTEEASNDNKIENKQLKLASKLNEIRHKSPTRDDVASELSAYKDIISESVYSTYFDVSNDEVYMNYFALEGVERISYTESEAIFKKEGNVSTVYVIANIEYIYETHEGEYHGNYEAFKEVTRYTFDGEKLVGFTYL